MLTKKIGLILAATTFAMAPLLGLAHADDASSASDSSSAMGMRVSAVLPENQVNKAHTYFDLLVKPNDEQTLVVNLTNTTDKAQTVNTEVSAAKTNINGVAEYGPSNNKLDQSVPFDFGKVAETPKQVEVPANSTKKLEVKIKIPNKTWQGIVAGGITITQAASSSTADTSSKAGVTIRNRYAYAIGVVLQTADKTDLKEKLNLAKVSAGQISSRNAVISELHNTTEAYLNGISVTSKVTRQNSKKVIYEAKKSSMQIAPNAVFEYPLSLEGHAFKAGRYTMNMTVKSKKSTWHFTKNFTITNKEAKSLNDKDVTLVHDEGFNWWWLVAIAIVLIAGIFFWWHRRRKDKGQVSDEIN
ncbi:DUF916 and DUF3324 domain-containing protein [Leuconostoc pseudomesenteroides]|uniref:DUF916 and DUF3324 domain-containing protein n=1 Tax=Leuconostoc pseudomesenteroides TaxID=33968 RepID=UPI00301D514D